MKKILLVFFLATFFVSVLRAQTSPCYVTTGIPFAWDSLLSPMVTVLADDQYSQIINIGFPFCFFGTHYSQLLIGSNGTISFNLTYAGGYATWPINTPLPSPIPVDIKNSILFPWQELLPPSSGQISYQMIGTAPYRKFVVQFNNVAMFSCTGLHFTGEVALYESTNDIETHIVTKDICANWNQGGAIHAIQNSTGTVAAVVPGRNASQWITSNEGVRFSPVCGCPNQAGANAISGKVYRDNNYNCAFDAGDVPLANTFLRLDPGSIFYTTDALGDYVMHTDSGNYTVTQIVPLYYAQLCPANSYQVYFPTTPLTYPNADFADSARNCHDITVGITSGNQRICRANNLYIQVCNYAVVPANNVILTVTLPDSTTLVSPLNFIANPSQGVYQYSLGTILPNQCVNLTIVDSLDCAVQLWSMHCFNASVTADSMDCAPENNDDIDCRPAVNSVDPNNKEVASQNFSQNGYVVTEDISPSDTLTYSIHFQNTGNDVAYNVVIMDAISPYLDLGTIEVIAASHPYIMTLNDHTAIFSFNNIMLPDSNANEPASHGMIKFRILQNPGNQPGTDIVNSAEIYFDINPPLLTNQTHNYIPISTAIEINNPPSEFLLFPNPAMTEVTLQFPREADHLVRLTNVMGKLLYEEKSNLLKMKLDISSLPSGVYFITAIDAENNSLTRKIVKM